MYSDRIVWEKPTSSKTIYANQISSVERSKLLNQLILETSGGKVSIPITGSSRLDRAEAAVQKILNK